MRTTPPTLRDNNVRTSEWSRLLQRSGDRANARCNETGAGPPPRTAFCIAGAARSFAAPLMQVALWNHLIRACNLRVTSNPLVRQRHSPDSRSLRVPTETQMHPLIHPRSFSY